MLHICPYLPTFILMDLNYKLWIHCYTLTGTDYLIIIIIIILLLIQLKKIWQEVELAAA